MARNKSNKSRGGGPGGKKKKKYGTRDLAKPKGKEARKRVAAKTKTAKKKRVAAKKRAPRRRVPKDPGSSEAEQMWDANLARCQALFNDDPQTWWEGMTGEDQAFGAWLQTQRYNRKIGRLRPDREARLKKVGFVWDTIEATWELHLKELKKFMRLKKAGRMWWRALAKEDPKLDLWVETQRRAKSHGELDEKREAMLDKIGFVWDTYEAMWEVRLEEYKEFIKDNPSGRVGKDNAPEGLFFWAANQRRKYGLGELDPERERRLEEVGFQWDGRKALKDEVWERHFGDLEGFHSLSGNANPGPDDDDETFRWLIAQRRVWDEMPEERRERLEKIGVSRTTPPGQLARRHSNWVPDWDKFFKDIAKFKKKHGHLRIGRDKDSERFPGLANFAGKLRSGALEADEEQQKRLDDMGFVWSLMAARTEATFNRYFDELVAFKNENGHTNVSQLDEKHKNLGQWATRMRQTRHDLNDEQRQRLTDLGFVWELKKEWMESQWELRFSELLEYKKQHGDTLVPQECPEWPTMTRWVSRMRKTKKELSEERIKRLDEIGFVWNAKAAEREVIEAARFAELEAFVKENGNARVTRGNDPTGGVLNGWIVRQRDKQKKGKMDPELEKRLDALGFVWNTR